MTSDVSTSSYQNSSDSLEVVTVRSSPLTIRGAEGTIHVAIRTDGQRGTTLQYAAFGDTSVVRVLVCGKRIGEDGSEACDDD